MGLYQFEEEIRIWDDTFQEHSQEKNRTPENYKDRKKQDRHNIDYRYSRV